MNTPPPELLAAPMSATFSLQRWSQITALMELGASRAPQILAELVADLASQLGPQTEAARSALQRAAQPAVEKTVN